MWLWSMVAVVALSGGPREASSFRLVVLHTNDMHSRFDEISASTGPCSKSGPCYGGFPRLAAAVSRLKGEDTIFLNAGDNFQGTPYFTLFKWRIVADFIDKIGLDVMSLGNHEFDNGPAGVAPYLKAVRTPTVAANVDLSQTPEMAEGNIRPSYNLYVQGVNISVIGYLTPDTKFLAKPDPMGINDEIPILQKLAREAKRTGAKIVIALGHSGFSMDKLIAEKVDDVDVVVGGHTDTFLYTGTPPDIEVPASTYPHMVTQPSGKKVPVVQAFGYTKYLGHLELEFDDQYKLVKASGNPILLDASKPMDPNLLADLNSWKANMSSQLSQVIGRTVSDLDGNCRGRECNLGNFFTDAVVDYHIRELEGQLYDVSWTNAPIALMNSGGIRTSLHLNDTQGNFTEWDVMMLNPFDNKVDKITIDGKELIKLLEISMTGYDATTGRAQGRFLQMSGVRVVYDMSKPELHRVHSVELRCGLCKIPKFEPLNMTAKYNVLISDFLVNGGDSYSHLKNLPPEAVEKLGWTENEALRSYAAKSTPFYPSVEGRIKSINTKTSGGTHSVSSAKTTKLSALALILTLFPIFLQRTHL